jgi:hypothetical protein
MTNIFIAELQPGVVVSFLVVKYRSVIKNTRQKFHKSSSGRVTGKPEVIRLCWLYQQRLGIVDVITIVRCTPAVYDPPLKQALALKTPVNERYGDITPATEKQMRISFSNG